MVTGQQDLKCLPQPRFPLTYSPSVKRIILVTEHEPDLQTHRCVDALRAGLAGDFELVPELLNGDGPARILGKIFRLRSLCRGAHAVHAWGYRALRIASFTTNIPILYTPLPDDHLPAVRWLLAAMPYHRIRTLFLSSGDHRFFITHGLPADSCQLVRPGVRMPRITAADPDLRRKLGLAPDDRVILALGQSRPHANHPLALQAISILHFMNPHYRLLIWGKGPDIARLQRLQTCWKTSFLVNASAVLGNDVEFEQLIPLADMGLLTAGERLSMQPILACMAAGLPLVGPATYAASELLEDHHTALLYTKPTSRLIAHKVLALAEDPGLRRRLADQAKAEAYELFSVSQFLDAMRQVYSG